ncbi:MAG: hypothetical protein KTR32_34200 [Granulosicoccus sp.]|nr:hypothetical protein [Granulosicoccus sp.]
MNSRKQSFEHFYLTKVALGDCCGCAERVIDWRDIEMAAAKVHPSENPKSISRISKFSRWFKRKPDMHSPYPGSSSPVKPFRR